MIHIHDINDPRIADYHSLKTAQDLHSAKKMFLTDGDKTTLNVLHADIEMHSLFALEHFYEEHKALIDAKIPAERQYTTTMELMESIVGFRLHSGVMAMGCEKPYLPVEELQGPIIALNGIINSDNVGGIIRNAIGMGFTNILFDAATSSPYLRRAVRVSMGTISRALFSKTENLSDTLAFMADKYHKRIIAAEITSDSVDLSSFEFPEEFILVFGSEGRGIEQSVLDVCGIKVHIPMYNQVQSLNVSSTSGIMLYQAGKRIKQGL